MPTLEKNVDARSAVGQLEEDIDISTLLWAECSLIAIKSTNVAHENRLR